MPERPRKSTKLSEHPFFLCADVWEQDTLTSQSETLCREGYLQMSHLCGPEELERKNIPKGPALQCYLSYHVRDGGDRGEPEQPK